jgi:hypothetical protein
VDRSHGPGLVLRLIAIVMTAQFVVTGSAAPMPITRGLT